VPDFSRVFLMLKYTDITQNTYIQRRTVTEIMAREKCGLLAVPRTAPFQLTRYVYTAHVLQNGMCLRAHVKCLENPKDDYGVNASVYVVQCNGFMSLIR